MDNAYVKEEISRQEARQILSRPTSFFTFLGRKKCVPPQNIELIYLPFFLSRVNIEEGEKRREATVCLDGLTAEAFFFARDNLEYRPGPTHPVCPSRVTADKGQPVLENRCRWVLIEQRLKQRKAVPRLEFSPVREIFYPFWLGYFKKRGGYDFKAIDALSGQEMGLKMRPLFLAALRTIDSHEESGKPAHTTLD